MCVRDVVVVCGVNAEEILCKMQKQGWMLNFRVKFAYTIKACGPAAGFPKDEQTNRVKLWGWSRMVEKNMNTPPIKKDIKRAFYYLK